MFNPVVQSRPFPSMALPYNPWKRHPLPASIADTQGNGGVSFAYVDPWLYYLVDSSGTKATQHTILSTSGVWWEDNIDSGAFPASDVGGIGWYQDDNIRFTAGPMAVNDYLTFDLNGELTVNGIKLYNRDIRASDGKWLKEVEVFVTTDTNADNSFFDDSGFTYTSVGTFDFSNEWDSLAGTGGAGIANISFDPVAATYVKIVCTAVHGVATEPDWEFYRIEFRANGPTVRYFGERSELTKSHMFLAPNGWATYSDHPDTTLGRLRSLEGEFFTEIGLWDMNADGPLDLYIEGPALTISRIVFSGYWINPQQRFPSTLAIYLREAGGDYEYWKTLKMDGTYQNQMPWMTYDVLSLATFPFNLIIPQAEYTGFRVIGSAGSFDIWAMSAISFYNEYLTTGTDPNALPDDTGSPILDQLSNVAAAWSTASIGELRRPDAIASVISIDGTPNFYTESETYDGTLAADTNTAQATGLVSRLLDRTGNGHHLGTLNLAQAPRATDTSDPFAPISDKSIYFANGDYMTALDQSTYNFAGTVHTVFAVVGLDSVTHDCYFLSKGVSGGFFMRFLASNHPTAPGALVMQLYQSGSALGHWGATYNNNFSGDGLHVFAWKLNGSDTGDSFMRLWVDGTEISLSPFQSATGTYADRTDRSLHVGTWDNSPAGATTTFEGKMNDIIWCSTELDDSVVEAVSADLMTIHGIS